MPPLASWWSRSSSIKDIFMEKRLLLAIVLSFLILFLYQAFFAPKKPPTPVPQNTPVETNQELKQVPAKTLSDRKVPEEPAKAKQQEDFEPTIEQREAKVTIDTSKYYAVWSSKGAVLTSWRLREHKDQNGEDLEIVSSYSQKIGRYPFFLWTGDLEFDNTINNALFEPSRNSLQLDNGKEGEVRFLFADDKGNKAEKIFRFRGGVYDFAITINLWKNGQKIEPSLIWGPSIGNPFPEAQKSRYGGATGITVYTAAKAHHQNETKYDPEKSTYNFVSWAAYNDQYFAALFLTSPQKTSTVFLRETINQVPYYFMAVNFANKVYIGPKSFDNLSKLGPNTKKLVRFGLFGFIAEILYVAIKAIHNVIPNWGFSIIILTILIKILFFPLTYSSTKSMSKMQELQPKIKALKSKYKKAKKDIDQRRKMNEETMKLYKGHGVNPAGGCLPMLVQLPIFWGFFRLLIVAIEFRHAPFILWLTDLSAKDPYYITPILMGITQFISQKMTPTAGDATQKKMMLFMPVIMTIFFMNFQCGLVLYWLTNNVLQIGQQYIMNRFMHKQKRETHGKRRKK